VTCYSFLDLGVAVGSVLGGLVAGRLGYGTTLVLGVVPGTAALALYLTFGRSPGEGRVTG
jgi:predicted MFS family arabinose efflux permease